MGEAARKLERNFTYKDYLGWDDDKRYELIVGKVYLMVPAPNVPHQSALRELFGIFFAYFKNRECEIFVAPTDVVLLEKGEKTEDAKNVVQPDIFVVCDKEKIAEQAIVGAPDLAVEIISPNTAIKDKREKFALYEKHGVKEYWLVHPEEKTLTVFRLENSRYGRPEIFAEEDIYECALFPDLKVDVSQIFKR